MIHNPEYIAKMTQLVDDLIGEACQHISNATGMGPGDASIQIAMRAADGLCDMVPGAAADVLSTRVALGLAHKEVPENPEAVEAAQQAHRKAMEAVYSELKARLDTPKQ